MVNKDLQKQQQRRKESYQRVNRLTDRWS